jgi:hypothetical protein
VLTAQLDAFAFELLSFLTLGQTLRGNAEPAGNVHNLPARAGA